MKLKRLAPGYYQYTDIKGRKWEVSDAEDELGGGRIWRVFNPLGASLGDVFYTNREAVEALSVYLKVDSDGWFKGLGWSARR